jgi:hypothetical protein
VYIQAPLGEALAGSEAEGTDYEIVRYQDSANPVDFALGVAFDG